MGLGPTEPCVRLSQHPASPWGPGRQRVDPRLWPGGHCLAANGSGSDTSSGLRTQLLCERSAPHRRHPLTHTHARLRTQLLNECLAPQTSHTDTHTHSSQQRTLTFRHIHGSGHSFCTSAWHHTDATHRHTHSSQQCTLRHTHTHPYTAQDTASA